MIKYKCCFFHNAHYIFSVYNINYCVVKSNPRVYIKDIVIIYEYCTYIIKRENIEREIYLPIRCGEKL